MTYKEFLTELHKVSKFERQQVSALVSALRRILVDEAISGNAVEIAGLGQFISHKHPEYIQTNEETGESVLYPPRISYRFSAICDSVSADATPILLVEYAGITEEDARLFLDSFAQVISTTVNNGEEVEVNGLGKFVMVDTNQSELRRMALILADTMKQEVNAPFSYFEPYVISKGVLVEEKPVEKTVEPESEEVVTEQEPKADEIVEESVPKEPIIENPKAKVSKKPEPKKNTWMIAACLAGIVVIAVSLLLILRIPSKPKAKTPEKEEVVAETVLEETSVEVAEETPVEVVEEVPVVEEDPVPVVKKDVKTHRMTDANGEPVTVTLEKGDRLTLVALRFFGRKEFWPYIFDVNTDKLKSPNTVNVGMRLYLPDPVYFDIDSLSEASLNKAKLRARELSKNN